MASAQPSKFDQKGVKRMLVLFGTMALLGILTMAFSVILGLVLLVIAEVFFAVAYRRFSKRPKPPAAA